MIIFKSLTIGILIFAWVLGYKYLAWDDHRVLGRNLLYSTIRASHIGICILVIGLLQKMPVIDVIASVLWGVAFGFMFVLVFALCWISREMDDEEADNNNL